MSERSDKSPFSFWTKNGSANRQFFLALIGIAVIVVIGVLWSQRSNHALVALLPGAKILEHEIGRAQLAFGAAGLNDFDIRAGEIWVPRARRDEYLKALADHQVLPDISRNVYDSDYSLDLWTNRQQQHEMSLLRKKKMIRQMLLQLEFVADAYVELDEMTTAGFPPVTTRKVAVVVRPTQQRVLENHQIRAIRETVLGQVAGLKRDDVVITDIAAGYAYVGDDALNQIKQASAGLLALEKARIAQRIADQLIRFGDDLDVQVEVRSAAPAATTQTPTPTDSTVNPALIVNQPVSLDSERSTVDGVEDSAKIDRYEIRVALHLANAISTASSGNGTRGTVDQQVHQLEQQIRSEIAPLLNSESLNCCNHCIDIVIERPASTALSAAAGANGSIAWSRSSSLAVLIGACALFFFLFQLWWRPANSAHRHSSRLPLASVDHDAEYAEPQRWSAGQVPLADETRQRLKEVVDQDPDQAAEIIKQWIRGAA